MLRRVFFAFAGLILAAAILLFAWYQVDGLARPEATAFLDGDGYTTRREPDGSLLFLPAQPGGRGIVILHGALIEPLSYAKSAAFFASRGYLVYLPHGGTMRLSIGAIDKAAARIASMPVADWYFIGHSMGGFSSLTMIRKHGINARAVALWGTAMPADFSDMNVPILFLWGDRDGLLPPTRFANAREKLPPDVKYRTLAGGNHQDFAMYTHQFFDNEGTLGWERQINIANDATEEFFDSESANGSAK